MKLFIFDLDGTLLNTLPTIAHYGNAALEKNGLSPYPIDDYKAFIGDGRDELIHRMLKGQNIDTPQMFLKVGGDYDAAYENDTLYLTEPYNNINIMLNTLKEKGIKLAVLSNKPDNVAKMVVEKVFPDVFDIVWGKKEKYPTKPDPTSVLALMEKLGVERCDTAFVGDTNVDIKTGKAAGLFAVGVSWGFRGRDELIDAGCDMLQGYYYYRPMPVTQLEKVFGSIE